jgi:Fic family protein
MYAVRREKGVCELSNVKIWKPIRFDDRWLSVDTSAFDTIASSWLKYRSTISDSLDLLQPFMEQLKREHAIETGIIERLYDLDEGITETLIKEGLIDSLVQHEDTETPEYTMALIHDQFEALDGVFSFVKEERKLTTSFIKELHSVLTRHQEYTEAITPDGKYVRIPLLRGEYKKQPNNPRRADGTIFEYCPPLNVTEEMERLMQINADLIQKGIHVLIRAAFFHHGFSTIHPFQDGNGRVIRILVSMILIKDGYFPFTIARHERKSYILSLEGADSGEYQQLIDLISSNQIRAINNALITQKLSEIKRKLEDDDKTEYGKLMKVRNDIFDNILVLQIKNFINAELLPVFNDRITFSVHQSGSIILPYVEEHAKQAGIVFKGEISDRYITITINDDRNEYYLYIFLYSCGEDNKIIEIGSRVEYSIDPAKTKYHHKYLPKSRKMILLSLPRDKMIELITQRINSIMLEFLIIISNDIRS